MNKKLLVRTVIQWLNACAIIMASFYAVTPAYAAPNTLTAFSKINPPDGATFLPLDATLSWGSSSGALLYNVCVSTDPEVSTCVFRYTGRLTSATLVGLLPNTTYYWQVEAEDRYENLLVASGGVWSFTTLGYAPPYNFALSHSSVLENSNIGTEVGKFSASDPDIDDPLLFTLQDAAGCDGNSSFTIDGNILRTAQVFDSSTQSSYIICARVIDGTGNAIFRAFTITILPTPKQTLIFSSQGNYDGWVLESSETSKKGGTKNNKSKVFYVGDDANNRQYRGILSFNTSAIPEDASITKVMLMVKKAGLVGSNPFKSHRGLYVDIHSSRFGTKPSLQTSDFQARASVNLVGQFSSAAASGWYTAVLSSASHDLINTTGLTQFRLQFNKDDNNDFGADYFKFYSGNASASSPQLIVEYSLNSQ